MSLIVARDLIREVAPKWLKAFWGYRLLYAMMILLDALVDAAVAAVQIRFPGKYSYESLAILGRERGIARGLLETDASYAMRLRRWRQNRRAKGSPVALLEQLHAYLTGYEVTIESIANNGVRYTIGTDGRTAIDQITWNWDGRTTTARSRFWIVIHGASALLQSEGEWGDPGVWGDGGTIGSTASPSLVSSIRQLVYDWTAPHAHCSHIIVVFDEGDWAAAPPDGTWNLMSRRNPSVIYWPGQS